MPGVPRVIRQKSYTSDFAAGVTTVDDPGGPCIARRASVPELRCRGVDTTVQVKKPYVENSVTAGGIAVPQFNQELCFKRFEVRDWNFQEPPLPSHHASARRRLARPLTPPPAPPSTRPTDRSPSARSTR